ncbi:MAG: NUDIX domain-containing protein [Myxococcota bacterium]
MKERALQLSAEAWRRLPRSARVAFIGLTNHRVPVGTIGLVHDGAGRVLLLEHRYRPTHPLGLPGGYLKKGEAPADGLRRELREETGLEISVEGGIFDTEYNLAGGYVALALVARATPGPLTFSSEISGGSFMAPEEVPEATYPWHRALIQKWRIAQGGPGA